MELAKVEGTVVATVKSDRLKGFKLMVLSLVKPDLTPTGGHLVAVDTVHAGVGDVVLAVRGSSARQTTTLERVPADASIVAVVDTVVYKGKTVFERSAEESS